MMTAKKCRASLGCMNSIDRFRRRSPVRSVAIGLLAGLFLVRAMVPAGYMPDVDALAEGRLGIKICPAVGPGFATAAESSSHDHQGHHDHGPSHAGGHHGSNDADGNHSNDHSKDPCPFGTAVAKSFIPPAPFAIPATTTARTNGISDPASELVAIRPTGPPLGSRAPPLNLA